MKASLYTLLLALVLVPATALAQFESNFANYRPNDQAGVNVFEAPKDSTTADTPRFRVGVGFAQQFQALSHTNEAEAVMNASNVNVNQLMDIGTGFNLATANLNLDFWVADGVRVNLTTYLSSRHHPEAWVKGGYVQMDRLPVFHNTVLDRAMDYMTLKVGHFEINYGDAHFRRTDNGNAMHNPFVGNYIMDAFTTEIGAEVYGHYNGLLAMVGVTGGEINGRVDRPDDRAPSFYGKLGYDTQLTPDVRVRLTGSGYTTERSVNNTLYGGDRAGSRYYMVMENTLATTAAQFTSGLMNPGLRSSITAFQVNPFVKAYGFELFGVLERAEGRAANETEDRVWTQFAVDALYRFLPREQLYVGGRFNRAAGALAVSNTDVAIERYQLGAGWFVTPNILTKIEYVNQRYLDFPTNDIRHGGSFNGIMIEGVIAF